MGSNGSVAGFPHQVRNGRCIYDCDEYGQTYENFKAGKNFRFVTNVKPKDKLENWVLPKNKSILSNELVQSLEASIIRLADEISLARSDLHDLLEVLTRPPPTNIKVAPTTPSHGVDVLNGVIRHG